MIIYFFVEEPVEIGLFVSMNAFRGQPKFVFSGSVTSVSEIFSYSWTFLMADEHAMRVGTCWIGSKKNPVTVIKSDG